MNKPCCGNCEAWAQTNETQGECHLAPPQAIFMGFQQAKLAGQPPVPMIAGAFPACGAASYCRQWQPKGPHKEANDKALAVYREHLATPSSGNDTFTPAAKPPTGREHLHTPVKVAGAWLCSHCGLHEDLFHTRDCSGNG